MGRVVEGSCGFCIFKAAPDPFRLRPRQHGEHGKSVGNLFCVAFGFWARGTDCPRVHPIFFWIEIGKAPLAESCTNSLLAVKCCIENNGAFILNCTTNKKILRSSEYAQAKIRTEFLKRAHSEISFLLQPRIVLVSA